MQFQDFTINKLQWFNKIHRRKNKNMSKQQFHREGWPLKSLARRRRGRRRQQRRRLQRLILGHVAFTQKSNDSIECCVAAKQIFLLFFRIQPSNWLENFQCQKKLSYLDGSGVWRSRGLFALTRDNDNDEKSQMIPKSKLISKRVEKRRNAQKLSGLTRNFENRISWRNRSLRWSTPRQKFSCEKLAGVGNGRGRLQSRVHFKGRIGRLKTRIYRKNGIEIYLEFEFTILNI